MRLAHGVTALAVVCAVALSGCSLSQVPYEESAWKTVVSTELAELDGAPGYYLRSEVNNAFGRSVIDYEYLPKDEAGRTGGEGGPHRLRTLPGERRPPLLVARRGRPLRGC